MREFLTTNLKTFAAQNPKIEFVVEQRSGHPLIIGDYVNGKRKAVSVRKLTCNEVNEKVTSVKNSSGNHLQKYKYPVKSINESVRGIWSPVHAQKEYRFKI